jgi:IS5 family transposase
MSRILETQIGIFDLQMSLLGLQLNPTLRGIGDFLQDHPQLVEQVRRDLQRGLKKPGTGRNGISPEQTLRSLALMRLENWDYRQLRERINDGITLRHFTQFHSLDVPQHDAFNRAINRLTPETMQAINQVVIQAAVQLGLEDGKTLRVDTTVVETNIHYPTDATLLWDAVRTLTRLVGELHEQLPQGVKGFTNRSKSARRRMQEIERMTASQRQQQQTPKYRELLSISGQVVAQARRVAGNALRVKKVDIVTAAVIQQLCKEISHYSELADRVIDQARRRVLEGEQVPAEEKVYSIFEPHTDVIKRGKKLKPVEFGHKVFLAESAQGLITDYQVLTGNPSDMDHVQASLERHQKTFGCAPDVYAGDRGFYSEENLEACQKAGVGQECIPQRGGQKSAERAAIERSAAFKKGQRFRVGIEGRISVLFRGRGMKRCMAEGRERFEVLVGAAVLANNLMKIAELMREQKTPLRRRVA